MKPTIDWPETWPQLPALGSGTYAISWKFMPDGWLDDLGVTGHAEMVPLLVDRNPEGDATADDSWLSDGFNLLFGVLIEWQQTEFYTYQSDTHSLDEFRRCLLEDTSRNVGYPSLEAMVLDATTALRYHHGVRATARCLNAAGVVLPESVLVHKALIEDLWLVQKLQSSDPQGDALQVLVGAYRRIDFDAVPEQDAQPLHYICLVSLALLGWTDEQRRFYERVARPKITDLYLLEHVETLMSDPSPNIAAYKIWNVEATLQ